jgi:hypothetical protein
MKSVRTLPVFRWILIGLGVFLGAIFAGVGAWFYLRPLESYRPLILAELKKASGAESVSLGELSWHAGLTDLSLGARVRDVRLERVPGLPLVSLPSVELRIQPIKLLFGKVPVKARVKGGEAVIAKAAEQAVPTPKQALPESAAPSDVAAGFVRVDLEVDDFAIVVDPALAGSPGEDSTLRLSDLKIRSAIVGYPGSFDLDLSGRAEVDLKRRRIVANGPFRVSLEGYSQTEGPKIVGVKISEVSVDLNKMLIGLGGVVEKTDSMECRFDAKAQAILDTTGAPKQFKLDGGVLSLGSVKVDVSGDYGVAAEEASVRWALPRTEVKDFRFPLAVWRHVPVSGIVESAGVGVMQKGSPRAGNWRVALTQFRIDTAAFKEVLDPSSKGVVSFSFVSEGTLDQGRISSPRTEFQLEGGEAQIEYGRGRFVKPAGHVLSALVKASVQGDRLELEDLSANLHTFQLHGRGFMDGLSGWLQGGKSKVKLNAATNRVDLSGWSGYTAALHKPLLIEGLVEAAGSLDGEIGGDTGTSGLNWRIDRLNLSNVRATLDEDTPVQLGLAKEDWTVSGPLSLSFLLQGRGTGSVVDRASLATRFDLSRLAFKYKDEFRKADGVPLLLDISSQASKNQLKIQKGSLRFHELDLAFQGQILQGSRKSFVDLSMARPIRLSDWKAFFLKAPKIPLEGTVQWKGRVGFAGARTFEAKLDLTQLAVEGELQLNDIGGRVSGYRNPLRKGQGKMLLQAEGIVVPSLSFEMGKAKANISGRVAPKGSRNSATLARYLTAKGWEGELQLALSRLNEEDFAPDQIAAKGAAAKAVAPSVPAGPTMGERVRELLAIPALKQSNLKLSLRVPEGRVSDIAFADLNARTLWKEGLFNLQPFGLKVFGGRVNGSVVFDATHFYNRKEAPQVSVSVKTENVDLGEALKIYKPELAQTSGGRVSGDLTLSMQGFETEEWIKTAKGRLVGRIDQGRFDTMMALRDSLDSFALRSEAKAFLLKEYQKEQCLQKNFDGGVDVQIDRGRLVMEKGELKFATGSEVRLKGVIEADLKTQLTGDFLASPACLGGDVRGCLAGPDGRAVIPFRIGGTALEPKPDVDTGALAKKAVACATTKVRAQAESEVRKRLEEAKDAAGDKAKEKLKNLFKRGG